ncbi:MAG: hypothetical protein ACI9BH_002416, partial [Paracoccaceae bacterium]
LNCLGFEDAGKFHLLFAPYKHPFRHVIDFGLWVNPANVAVVPTVHDIQAFFSFVAKD